MEPIGSAGPSGHRTPNGAPDRIYLKTQRDGVNYNLAYIPDDADLKPKDEFVDPEYMRQLFDLGYRLAKAGYPWHNAPPGFETGSVSAAQ